MPWPSRAENRSNRLSRPPSDRPTLRTPPGSAEPERGLSFCVDIAEIFPDPSFPICLHCPDYPVSFNRLPTQDRKNLENQRTDETKSGDDRTWRLSVVPEAGAETSAE